MQWLLIPMRSLSLSGRQFDPQLHPVDSLNRRFAGFNRVCLVHAGSRRFDCITDPTCQPNRLLLQFTVGPVRPVGLVRFLKLWVEQTLNKFGFNVGIYTNQSFYTFSFQEWIQHAEISRDTDF